LNQPTVKQITVPLNSTFGVAVKVTKDGEPLSCELDELSVNGMSAEFESAGYCVFALSSDAAVGIRRLDVRLDKDDAQAAFPLLVQQRDFGYFDV